MISSDLQKRINEKYDSFTKAEKKVCDFISSNLQTVLYMSITDIADACGVGDTSVFRFCKSLGLNGFQELRVLLAQSMATMSGESNIGFAGEIRKQDCIEDVCDKVLAYNVAALNDTYKAIDYSKVQAVVDLIKSARQLHFFGLGSSGVSALEAQNKFLRIIPNVSCSLDSHMQAMSAKLLTSEDVAIAFSYSGSTRDIVEIVKNAKLSGAVTVCITHFKKSPLAHYADIVLLCASAEGPFQGGAISSKISQLFVLDIIYNEYFRQNYELCQRNKEITSGAISKMLL